DLVFEEALVVVPGLFFFRLLLRSRSLAAILVRVSAMQVQRVNAFLSFLRLQREVEALDRRCAFDRQLFTDALLVLEALDLVTTRTAVLLDQRLALLFQLRIVHEGGGRIIRRRRKREEISRDVARIRLG